MRRRTRNTQSSHHCLAVLGAFPIASQPLLKTSCLTCPSCQVLTCKANLFSQALVLQRLHPISRISSCRFQNPEGTKSCRYPPGVLSYPTTIRTNRVVISGRILQILGVAPDLLLHHSSHGSRREPMAFVCLSQELHHLCGCTEPLLHA